MMWVNLKRGLLLLALFSLLLVPLYSDGSLDEKDKVIAQQAARIVELETLLNEWTMWYGELTPDQKSSDELWREERASRIALEMRYESRLQSLETELGFWKIAGGIELGGIITLSIFYCLK